MKKNSIFSDLILLHEHEVLEGYNLQYLSVFDHWLSCEEADKVLTKENILNLDKYKVLLNDFNVALLEKYRVIPYRIVGRDGRPRVIFKENTKRKKIISLLGGVDHFCRPSFSVVIPELKIIYIEGFDYTNLIYSKGVLEKDFYDLAAQKNLFII